ncbi:MAG: HDOD domain-containing protein [Ectothiorhodospiraceae bacterium]|nr:HDOD domain-containing protein [Ectothiorhodospiraceae bacterium]
MTGPRQGQGNEGSYAHLIRITESVKAGKLGMPGVPEAALRVRQLIATEAGAAEVAAGMAADPSLAAYILKVANGVSQRSHQQVTSLSTAVTRLGLRLVGVMVTHYMLMQLADAAGKRMRSQVEELYNRSRLLAAYCHALARRHSAVPPEDAMLAGLLHDLGAFPVLAYVAGHAELRSDPAAVEALMARVREPVGGVMLRTWHCPPGIVEAIVHRRQLVRSRPANAGPDLADVLTAAQVELYRDDEGAPCWEWPASAPALKRLGLNADSPFVDGDPTRVALEEAGDLLAH